MKILISYGSLSAKVSANTKIVLGLADKLLNQNHEVLILTQNYKEDENKNSKMKIVSVEIAFYEKVWLEFLEKNKELSYKKVLLKFLLKQPVETFLIFLSKMNNGMLNYKKVAKKVIKENDIEAIISISMPFDNAYATSMIKLVKNKIYYQLDPYGLFETEIDDVRRKRIKREIGVIKNSKKVITTKILLKEYLSNENYKKYKDKFIAWDFPLISEKNNQAKSAFDFKKEDINLLFCGTLDNENRNPAILINLLEEVFLKYPNVKLYFLGNVECDVINNLNSKLKRNIIIKSAVLQDVAEKTMQEADVLINIGNTYSNMVPSKIFDYFSTGKPILNVERIENCPAREYINKYPYQFTFNEKEEITSEQIIKLEKFILQSKGEKLEFEKVNSIFQDATQESLVNKINEILNNI